jgi:hypothetical protein
MAQLKRYSAGWLDGAPPELILESKIWASKLPCPRLQAPPQVGKNGNEMPGILKHAGAVIIGS